MSDQGLNTDLVNKLLHLHHALAALDQAGYSVSIEHHSVAPLMMGNTVAIVNVTNHYYRNDRNEQIPYGQPITVGGEHATLSFPIVEQNPNMFHFRHNHHMLAVFRAGESKPMPFPQWHNQLNPLSAYNFDRAYDALALQRFRQMQQMEKMDLRDLPTKPLEIEKDHESISLTEANGIVLGNLLNPPTPPDELPSDESRLKYRAMRMSVKPTTCMCPACEAVWVFYPKVSTRSPSLKSSKSCAKCEVAGLEQLLPLYRDTEQAERALRDIASPMALDEAQRHLLPPVFDIATPDPEKGNEA